MPNFSAAVAAPAPRAASRLGGYCLFLDVDGTLVEFASTPEGVHVDPVARGADREGIACARRRARPGERAHHRGS